MKKIILLTFFIATCLVASAQSLCFSYKGEWSPWRNLRSGAYTWNYYSWGSGSTVGIHVYNNDSKLRMGVYLESMTKKTYFDFWINNYIPPTKKEIKQHWKNKQWYEYTGTVEYYVSDDYPTAEDLAKAEVLVIPNARTDTRPKVKRTARCTIKIAPYKKEPEVFNIWFDNIGVGISVEGLKFGK